MASSRRAAAGLTLSVSRNQAASSAESGFKAA
jgi:hypothetical protein